MRKKIGNMEDYQGIEEIESENEIELPEVTKIDIKYLFLIKKLINFRPEFQIDSIRKVQLKSGLRLLDRATINYFLGTRCFYIAIPVGLWILNTWAGKSRVSFTFLLFRICIFCLNCSFHDVF